MKNRLILLLSLSGLLLQSCSRTEPPSQAPETQAMPAATADADLVELAADSPKLARIRTETVGVLPFPADEVAAPGKVEVNPNRISRVVMPVSGRIRRVLVRLGDAVSEGQSLLMIDSPDAGAAMTALRQAEAQARQAGSAFSKAQKDLARIQELYEHRAAALKDVVSAENDLAQAQSAIDQSQAATDDAKHRLEVLGIQPGGSTYVEVKAPLPGKVLEIAVVPGEYRNDTNSPLMTIADLGNVWVSADVPESMIRRVDLGEMLELELSAFPGRTFGGRVTRISDMVDPQTRTIKVQAEIANPGGQLRPEMYGQIRHNHGLVSRPAVPAGAILMLGGSSVALVEENPGRFRKRIVETNGRKGDMLAVLAGLKEGERIVVDGAMLLLKKD
jgi:membrane fusion protein, heavy metal efflux system